MPNQALTGQASGKYPRKTTGGKTIGGKTPAGRLSRKSYKPFKIPRTTYGLPAKKNGRVRIRKPSKPSNSRKTAGSSALKEIRYYQSHQGLICPKSTFTRLIREILQDIGSTEFRIQSSALEAIQESAEAFLIEMLAQTNLAAIHANRVTIQKKDMKFILNLIHRNGGRDYLSTSK